MIEMLIGVCIGFGLGVTFILGMHFYVLPKIYRILKKEYGKNE